jgi:LacI family transcriptional regulator
VATASGVINEKSTVKPALVRRVQEAMAALDYHPDHVARSLRSRKTFSIGAVITDITNPFFTEVIRGAEKEAQSSGYSIFLCDSCQDTAQENHYLNTLFSRRVDGILLAPTGVSPAQYASMNKRLPTVLIDTVPQKFTGAAVIIDNFGAARDGTRYLIGLGHSRIAIIAGPLDLSTGFDRLEGFRKALQEQNLPLRDEYLKQGHFQSESGYRCALELMRFANPPTAIFSCNNRMTLGLMRALSDLGIPCPGTVSVLGFDDLGRLGKSKPDGSNFQAEDESLVTLKAELRIRDSTAAPAAALETQPHAQLRGERNADGSAGTKEIS